MTYELKSVLPAWGTNYGEGWSFGTFRDDAVVSSGIAWFTRWDGGGYPPVSHVGLVKDHATVIEADMKRGVVETPLDKYFDDPHVHIYFRKPRGLDRDSAIRITTLAESQLGAKYDKGLIRAHLMSGTFLGRWIDLLTDQGLQTWLSRRMDDPDQWICSELTAWVMQGVPRYCNLGCLRRPACTITPVEYCWDAEIFKGFEQG